MPVAEFIPPFRALLTILIRVEGVINCIGKYHPAPRSKPGRNPSSRLSEIMQKSDDRK